VAGTRVSKLKNIEALPYYVNEMNQSILKSGYGRHDSNPNSLRN